MKNPTSRTHDLYSALGFEVSIVERRVSRRVTIDFAGFADLIAFDFGQTIAIQATDLSNMGARQRKITDSRKALIWASSTRSIHLIGWDPKQNRANVYRIGSLNGQLIVTEKWRHTENGDGALEETPF